MKNKIIYIFFGIIFSNHIAFSQNQFTCDASINNEAAINISTAHFGNIKVYPGTRNNVLPENKRCYFIMPVFKIKTIDGKQPDIYINKKYVEKGFFRAKITLLIKYPPKTDVLNEIRKINKNANTSNIRNLTLRDIIIYDKGSNDFQEIRQLSEGNQPFTSNEIPLTLIFEDKLHLDYYIDEFKNKEAQITIRATYREADVKMNYVNIDYNQILNSKSFSNYLQKTKGEKIDASKISDFSYSLITEFKTTYWQEIDIPENELNLFEENFAQRIKDLHKSIFVSVDDIQKMINDRKVDLSSKNFQPDVIKHFAYDVKKISKEEFKNKYEKDYLHHYKMEDRGKSDVSGKLDVIKIFNIGANYKSERLKKTDDQLKTHFYKEDYYKGDFDNSFKYEWDGEKIKRLSIKLYEPLDVNIINKGNESVYRYKVTFIKGATETTITAEDIAFDTN